LRGKKQGCSFPHAHGSFGSVFFLLVQLEGEYAGDTSHISFRLAKGPSLYASYMQSITPRFAMGGDSVFDLNEGMGIMSFGGRYSTPDYSVVGMLGQVSYDLIEMSLKEMKGTGEDCLMILSGGRVCDGGSHSS